MLEHVPEESIFVTGNTVIDALHWVVERLQSSEELRQEQIEFLKINGYDTGRLSEGKKLVLITGHRRENFGEGFLSICRAIK